MASKSLNDKISALPAEKKAEVEDFVDFVSERVRVRSPASRSKAFPDEVLRRIDEERERLFREHGLFPDSTEIIRELREHGD